jgi:ferrous iron transport protein A
MSASATLDRLHPAPLPLCQLPAGQSGRVCALTGEASFCQRVREMGFGERAFVTKVGGHGPFICMVNGSRLALSHAAAAAIQVEPLGLRPS